MSDSMALQAVGPFAVPARRGTDPNAPTGMPSNISHAATFSFAGNGATKSYMYTWDEAIRDDPNMALNMRRDAYLTALVDERKRPVALHPWAVKCKDENDPEQVRVAGVLTSLIESIPSFLKLRMCLLSAVFYGRYGVQLYYDRVSVGGESRWAPVRWEPVNGDKINHNWDGTPMISVSPMELGRWPKELQTYGAGRTPALILGTQELRDRFVIHQHEVDDADYFEGEMAGGVHGVGLRSRMYWNVWMRDKNAASMMDALQRAGTSGVWLFWFEQGNSAAEKAAQEAMLTFERDNVLLMPRPGGSTDVPSWGIEQVPADTSGLTFLQSFITDYHERHIERLVIGQSLSSGTEGSGLGGTGVAALHEDTKYQILLYDAGNLDETLTVQLLRVLLKFNEPNASPTDYSFVTTLPDPRAGEKLAAVKTASDMGVDFDRDEVRNLTGLSKPAPGAVTVGGSGNANAGPGVDGIGGMSLGGVASGGGMALGGPGDGGNGMSLGGDGGDPMSLHAGDTSGMSLGG